MLGWSQLSKIYHRFLTSIQNVLLQLPKNHSTSIKTSIHILKIIQKKSSQTVLPFFASALVASAPTPAAGAAAAAAGFCLLLLLLLLGSASCCCCCWVLPFAAPPGPRKPPNAPGQPGDMGTTVQIDHPSYYQWMVFEPPA